MKHFLMLLVIMASNGVQAQDHSAHQHEAASVPGTSQVTPESTRAREIDQDAAAMLRHAHGASLNYLVLGERFEWLPDQDIQQWSAQGWYGSDLNRLWVKTEGHYDANASTLERGELQLLYSKAVASFWDLQAGLRVDDGQDSSRSYATLGVQGLAPYWFEMNMAAFLSDQGQLSTRLEAEYELRFTQRLVLQPRLELNYSFSEDPAAGIAQGISEALLGLRLRYEVRREFAPYIGFERGRAYGGTAGLLKSQGLAPSQNSWVMGLRFWY